MKKNLYILWPAILAILLFCACTARQSNLGKNEAEKSTAKVIAVLPVENKTHDSKATHLLRLKVLDELYFKGYSRISLEEIDKKLEPLYTSDKNRYAGVVSPDVIKDLVGADAAMYCTLTEGNRKTNFIYVTVTVAAHCELRSTQIGEVLWKSQYKSTSRNFDLPGKRLEGTSCEAFETVIESVANKVLETLPEGPNLKV
jgi:hypothetical protein